MTKNNILWGIDLGGTKIECVALSKDTQETLIRKRIPTEAHKGYKHILAQIKNLLRLCETELNINASCLGIGTPGTIDPFTNTLKNSNTQALNGESIHKDLENVLQIPIRIANDANCFALAETEMGIVKQLNLNVEVVLGLIMGTGVGSGIVVNNKIISGAHGIAGEWGHNYLDESGGNCYCGRTGCVETIISGPALEAYYESLTGESLALKEIVKLSRGGNKAAYETIQRLIKMFGKALAPVINILDPDVIILGGGLGNITELETETKSEIEKYLFNPSMQSKILRPALGDSAGVFGAALLCKD